LIFRLNVFVFNGAPTELVLYEGLNENLGAGGFNLKLKLCHGGKTTALGLLEKNFAIDKLLAHQRSEFRRGLLALLGEFF